ncbi:hypothetical protein ACEOOH_00620 [Pseudomonas aeruginosa]
MNHVTQGTIAYPALAAAERAIHEARAAQIRLMEETFPYGTRVRVRHHRGECTGTVRQTTEDRIFVVDDTSGKTIGAYPLLDTRGKLSVEIID